jgi:uncharacterized membrane protein
VSGSPSIARLRPSRRGPLLGLLALLAALIIGPAGVAAAAPPTVTTPYPGVSVAPGAKVTFDLTVTAARNTTVKLAAERLPAGWTGSLRGGGYEISSVVAGPGSAAGKASLEVTVPADASPGRYPFLVRASSADGGSVLDLEVQVSATAGGQISLTSDFPSLSGAAGTTFTFTLTLTNDTPEDRTFAVSASGPAGWQVDARPASQAQAASLPVKASSAATITVTANPPDTVPAGTYPIVVKATEGGNEVDAQLSAEVIGQYKLALTTPDQRLNASGTAGSPIDFQLVVQNTGTAPLEAVTLASTPPTGWKVEFSPSATIATLDAGGSQTVTARMTPSDQAIAGDYVVTFDATASQASASQDIRVTVETSLSWAVVGIGLVVLALLGLAWVFQRFGRR